MKYERLTNIDKISLLKEEAWLTQEEEEYLRLAELEDKIENGTLVELPCKMGDKVYVIAKQGIDIYTVEETII